MRTFFILAGIMIVLSGSVVAQRSCAITSYLEKEISSNPSLAENINRVEAFIRQQSGNTSLNPLARLEGSVIKIPVVVHILYHLPGEDISNEKVFQQIEMLNQCFRRKNSDTSNTPAIFKPIAADCEIEFQLAISDPKRKSTNGIIHKYTPIADWQPDDMMKFSSQMGDDAWDPKNYLNIWVCNMRKVAGYSTIPGGSLEKDGVVINYGDFGPSTAPGFELGRTAVHEIGHWLGLKHLWGDEYCGDDLVSDTPKQSGYNIGCPSGTRITCGNGPSGDMYSNYMDYTNDGCINLFTEGQKNRMRALFAYGGARYSILFSYGLLPPLISEIPIPDEPPTWLHPQLYPNPATDELILDIAYDVRWIGQVIVVYGANGQPLMQVPITSKVQHIDIRKLRPGMYFISAKKEDGSFIKQKFVKM